MLSIADYLSSGDRKRAYFAKDDKPRQKEYTYCMIEERTFQTIPGPKAVLPAQNLFRFMRDPLDFLSKAAHEYGDLVNLHMGALPTFLLNDPEAIRGVLVTNNRQFVKSPVLRRMTPVLGEGLLTSDGDLHLRQRRLLQPAFHRQRIAEYARTMTHYALETSRRWTDGETVDVSKEMMRLTMVIVGQTLFGTNVEEEASEIGQAITHLLAGSRRLSLPFWEHIQKLPLPGNREMEQAGIYLDQTIREMIAERRAGEHTTRGDLLEMMLAARDEEGDGQGMSDDLIRDETMTLFLAGHETTANALTWTFYLLSRYPWVEDQLHAELQAVLRRPDAHPGRCGTSAVYAQSVERIDAAVPARLDYRAAGARRLRAAGP